MTTLGLMFVNLCDWLEEGRDFSLASCSFYTQPRLTLFKSVGEENWHEDNIFVSSDTFQRDEIVIKLTIKMK